MGDLHNQSQWVNSGQWVTLCATTLCAMALLPNVLESVLFNPALAPAKMKRITEIGDKLAQQINVFFCVKLGWTVPQTKAALQAVYGQRTLHRNRIALWHNEFTHGRTRLVDQECAHKRRTTRMPANIAAVQQAIDGDRRLSVLAIHRQTGISESGVFRILRKDLHLSRKAAKFVPALLTPHHLRTRYECASTVLANLRANPDFLKTVVTMDESWVYTYDPELKYQSAEWLPKGAPRPTKPQRPRSCRKSLLLSFFDYRGMLHFEFLRNRTVNTEIFLDVLARLRTALQNKRPRTKMLLHMDNASPHTSRDTRLFLLLTGQKTMAHPPNSPDVAPNDYWFYPRVKKNLRGIWFRSVDDLETAVANEIAQIPSHEFEECMLVKWPRRFARCVYKDGDYFEGQ